MFGPVICDPGDTRSLQLVRRHVKDIISFIEEYKWLIDAYLSDYFVLRHWEHVRPAWWEVLSGMEPGELASLLSVNHWKTSRIWPLSLIAFRATNAALSLHRSRTPEVDSIIHRLLGTTAQNIKNRVENPDTSTEHDRTSKTHDVLHAGSVSSQTEAEMQKEQLIHSVAIDGGKDDQVVPPTEKTTIRDGQYPLLEHCYRRHVKPKKQHEILSLAKTIHSLSCVCSCDHVIDVGAGQGHLSRLLSFGHELKVTTIEAADTHAPKAHKFDREVKRDIELGRVGKKRRKKNSVEQQVPPGLVPAEVPEMPTHVVAWIDPSVSVAHFLQRMQVCQLEQRKLTESSPQGATLTRTTNSNMSDLCLQNPESSTKMYMCNDKNVTGCHGDSSRPHLVEETLPAQSQEDLSTALNSEGDNIVAPPFILTGLHACGDLTPTMMRVFAKCPQAVGLASVACCYMKMSSDSNIPQDSGCHGYPMSHHVRSIPGHRLTYEARELACHFADSYFSRLLEGSSSLRSHCLRSALQEVIQDKDPTNQHPCIKLSVKNSHQLPFEEYAKLALKKLGLPPDLTTSQRDLASERLRCWKDVVALYTLRLSLAPVVETLILLDRLLFLAEQGVQCCLVPIFDPELSPRNFALLARKTPRTNTPS